MKFWKRTALCLALCAALLTGCVPAADTASSAAPTDPLTGQEALWPGQRPVAVTIENETSSTTQWGLSSASLVLEALTEPQSSTSLCLVYPAVDAVPQVGPVAAGQDLYWRLLVGQQVLPVQRGGGAFDQNYLDYYSLRAVDALEEGTNAFTCDTTWTSRPLWRTSGNALAGVLRSLNISSALSESRLTDAASSAAGESESETSPTLSVPPLLPQQTEAAQKFLEASTSGVDINERMALATADASSAWKDVQGQKLRANARMGVNPNSGRFQGVNAALDTQKAAQLAGARTQARVGAEQENYERLKNAASFNATGGILSGLGALSS